MPMATKGGVFHPWTNTTLRRAREVLMAYGSVPILAETKGPTSLTLSHRTTGHRQSPATRDHVRSTHHQSPWPPQLHLQKKQSIWGHRLLNQACHLPRWKATQGQFRWGLVWRPPEARWESWPTTHGARIHTEPLAWTSMESVNFYHLGQATLFVTVRGRKICNC